MKTKTINFIKFVGEESEGFSDRIRDAALKDQDDFVAKLDAEEDFLDDENMSEEQQMYIDLMADREVLVQLLDNSKEFFEQAVNAKESQITKAIAKDQKDTEDNIINGQHKRNRAIVKEINDSCIYFREDISKKIYDLKGPEDD